MADQKQKPPIEKPRELEAVPAKKETQELTKQIKEINSAFAELLKKFSDAQDILDAYFNYEKGKVAFVLGWLSFSQNHLFIPLLPPGFVLKEEMSAWDRKKVNSALGAAATSLTKMFDLLTKAKNLLKEIEKRGATEVKATYDYIYLNVGVLFLSQQLAGQYENGLNAAKSEYNFERKIKPTQPVISEQKGSVVPIERSPPIEMAPTMADLFIYGPGQPIYYDPYTGAYGPKQTIDIARDIKTGIKKFEITPDSFLMFVPIVGPAICIVNDVKMIQEGTPEEKKMGKIMLVVDAVFTGIDVQYIVHLGVRSMTRMVGKDALIKMSKEKTAGALVTETEQKIFIEAASELDGKDMKKLLKLSQKKGGWGVVAAEIAGRAGDGQITKEVFKDYIAMESKAAKKWARGYLAEMYRDFSGLVSESAFKKNLGEFIGRELAHGADLKVLRALGGTMKGLPLKEKRVALSAIFNSLMTFSPNAQGALLNFVKKKGWGAVYLEVEKAVRDLGGPNAVKELRAGELEQSLLAEATRNALQKIPEMKEYALAYALSPFKEWIRLGVFIGFAHAVFKIIRKLGEYMTAKTEEQAKNIEKEIETYVRSVEMAASLPEVSQSDAEFVNHAAEMFREGAKE